MPTDQPPVLVLLHGLGADAHDLMGLAPELDPRLLIVSIQAPIEIGNGGYAWFDIRFAADGVHPDVEQAQESLELLIATLRSLPEALGIEPAQMLVGGFSQGAMMSLGVALAAPELLSGVISMSGRLMPSFVPMELNPASSEIPFLVQHGTSDGVLSVQGSRQIREFLEKLNAPVTYKEYPMAHEISLRSLSDVRDWIAERLP